MSEYFCLLITGLVECVLDSRCESSNCVPLQDLRRSPPSNYQHRTGEERLPIKCPICCRETRFCGRLLTEWVLTFHYIPVPIGRAVILYPSYEMSGYNFLQIFNFVVSFTTFASLHIVPSPRNPVHLYRRHRCTIWEAICRWSWDPYV